MACLRGETTVESLDFVQVSGFSPAHDGLWALLPKEDTLRSPCYVFSLPASGLGKVTTADASIKDLKMDRRQMKMVLFCRLAEQGADWSILRVFGAVLFEANNGFGGHGNNCHYCCCWTIYCCS